MKTNLTQRRFKARKGSSCAMCKPNKHGWEDKRTFRDLRNATKHADELKENRLPN